MGRQQRARFWRLVATLAITGTHCLPAMADDTAHPQSTTGAAVPATLPASLPVRRDAVIAYEPVSWTSSLVLLALASVGGTWLLWQRAARAKSAARGVGRADGLAVLRLYSQALTPQASVHAVRWNGEELLLGCTAQQVTLLSRRPLALQPRDQA
jgi:flagellar biogenesis protein FliO